MSIAYSTGVSGALRRLGIRKIAVDVRALLEESAPHLKDVALHTLGGTALGGLSGLAASDEDRIKGLRRGAIAGGLTGLGLSAGGKGLQYLTGRTPGQIAALETEGLAKLDAHSNAQHEADLLFDSYLADAREHAGLQAADRTRALRRPELNRLQQLNESLNTQRPELENLAKDYDAAEREYAQFRRNLDNDIADRRMDAALVKPLTRGATAVLAPAAGILSTGIGRDDGR
jgi:hypothetical protein